MLYQDVVFGLATGLAVHHSAMVLGSAWILLQAIDELFLFSLSFRICRVNIVVINILALKFFSQKALSTPASLNIRPSNSISNFFFEKICYQTDRLCVLPWAQNNFGGLGIVD